MPTTKVSDRFYPLYAECDETAVVEASAEEAEAIALTMTEQAEGQAPNWTYAASTEDAGTVGILDDEAGIIFSGATGTVVRCIITNFDMTDAAGMEETDTANLAIYVNSTAKIECDEGAVGIEETTSEFNLDGKVQLNEGDVVRVVVAMTGEEVDNDVDITTSPLAII